MKTPTFRSVPMERCLSSSPSKNGLSGWIACGCLAPTRFENTAIHPLFRDVAARAASSSAPSQLWAFDFDGVACDSCGESSLSAWKAAESLWPAQFTAPNAISRKSEIIEDMRAVRPVVETGYENIVQIRCLLEGVSVDDMLNDWVNLLPYYMDKWSLERSLLVDLFGKTRDAWMAEDLDGWLAPNKIYPGVPEVMRALMDSQETYIVTTKQARFTEAILARMAGIRFPPERIFSQTVSGRPKSEVLEDLDQKHGFEECYFVEDKLSTLEKVAKLEQLRHWHLLLVDWGYNTAKERERAEENDRIKVIDIAELQRLAGGQAL